METTFKVKFRYGWIPADEDVSDDICSKYSWISNISITHMEILHGAYRFHNPNALFCIRDPSFVENLPADHLSRFVDKEPISRHHLKILKKKLLKTFPGQVYHYQCHVDGIDSSTGRDKVKIGGLEGLSEKVLQFLCAAIERQYPDHHLVPDITPFEQEEQIHGSLMQTKSEFVVGRERELTQLNDYLSSGCLPSQAADDQDVQEDETWLNEACSRFGVNADDERIMAVVGAAGLGKSALLAKLASDAIATGKTVVYHVVGCTADSLEPSSVIQRLSAAAVLQQSDETHDVEQQGNDNVLKMKKLIDAAKSRDKRIIFIIDGLDKMADNSSAQFLDWLPPRVPGSICCVVSCQDSHRPCLARLEQRRVHWCRVEQLTDDGASRMIQHYLGVYNKRLDDDQLTRLLQHSSARVPLWLSISLEELRVFGDFATVSQKIADFPDGLDELAKHVIERLRREDETECVEKVVNLLCYAHTALAVITSSLNGAPEKSMLQLLGNLETGEDAAMASWATVRRHLKPFLRLTVRGSVRIQMAHQLFDNAVQQLILGDEDKRRSWHGKLADYYQSHCSDDYVVVDELPHQLFHARLYARLKKFYQTDFRSLKISNYSRSTTLNKLRCSKFSQQLPGAQRTEVLVCQFCAMRGRLLSPAGHLTRDSCAICGSWISSMMKRSARKCAWHSRLTANCHVCSRPIVVQQRGAPASNTYHELNLCMSCGSGAFSMRCCVLLDE